MAEVTKAEQLGVLLADFVAERVGSWSFIIWMTVSLLAWMAWNYLAPVSLQFDEPPYIAMNTILSLVAAYTGPVLLISANRISESDRAQIKEIKQDVEEIKRMLADLNRASTLGGH